MTTMEEALNGPGFPINDALKAAIDAISASGTVKFVLYVRLVLPMDGYVFWVKSDLVSDSAIYNACVMNEVTPNQPQTTVIPAKTFVARGSFHYATDTQQTETESFSVNSVVFTAVDEVKDLNAVGPNTIYIGEIEGTNVKFAFGSRGSFYKQADIFHYRGAAVYSDMVTQLVDRETGFNSQDVIVSNSLPIWLAMNSYVKQPWDSFGRNGFTMYPSFLNPFNLRPPFASVHVLPESTRGIASAPTIGPTLSHDQLVRETVKVTLWGTRNYQALDFVDFVNQYSLNTGLIGMMNVPVPRDDKKGQVELGVIAQKKTIEFEVNYLQSSSRDVARQLIKEAVPTFYFGD